MFEETRRELQSFISQSKKSQRQLSRELGLSTSVISQFLNNTYTGNNEDVSKTIRQYLSVSKEQLNHVQTAVFYKGLDNTERVLFTCEYAHTHNDITLVSGDAGAGKTTALEYYRDNHTGVILETATSCTTSPNAILRLICSQISKQVPKQKSAMMSLIVELLKDTNRLLIVDEADHLQLQALQAIRNINDLAHIGIVLSGNDKIYTQTIQGRRVGEFEQIRTRIVIRQRVYNQFSATEMSEIFGSYTPDCQAYLLKLAESESLRTAVKICSVATERASFTDSQLSIKILRDTQKQLLGVAI